jgi:predicted esterase
VTDLTVLTCDSENGPATATVVAIHGLGATAEDLVGVVSLLGLSGVRWVFPQGWMPVTHAFGQGWAWYEMPPNDRAGMLESRRRLHRLNRTRHR